MANQFFLVFKGLKITSAKKCSAAQEFGYEDAGQEHRTGNADEGKKKIECLPRPRKVRGSDGPKINQKAETESEKQ